MNTSKRQAHRASQLDEPGIDFLLSELDLGMTFLDVAETVHVPERKDQGIRDAEKAYQAVLRFLPAVSPTEERMSDIRQKAELLRARLEAKGVRV